MLSVFDQVALGPNEVCGILLGPSCGDPYNPWNQTWTVKLPPTPMPPLVPVPPPKVYTYMHTSFNSVGIGCTITEGGSCAARADSCAAHSLQPGSPVSKVLFLSDIHFDKNYTAGLNAECSEPLCCRPPNGPSRESLCLYTCSNSCTSSDQIPPLYILALVFLQLLASVQPAPGATTTVTVPCRPWRTCCSMSAT